MDIKKISLYIIVFVAIIAGVFIVRYNETIDNVILPTASPQPSISSSLAPSISPTPPPAGGPSPSPKTSPVSNLVPKCWLTGEIVYDGSVFKHIGAQEFNYKDVDEPHDIIKWQVSPSGETFSIGPNMFTGLNPIKGSDYLTISFEGLIPKYNKYDLSASVDYVAVVDNAAKILNVKCSGKTTLIINK